MKLPLVRVAVVLAAVIAPASVAHGATVSKKDGSVVEGEVLGTVILAQAGLPNVAVVEGKDTASITPQGIRLKPGAVVIHAGLPLGTDPAIVKSVGVGGILAATLPAAAKHQAVEQVPNAFGLVTGGDGEGPGFGTVMVGKSRAYFMKRFSENETLSVSGELRQNNGSYSVIQVLRVQGAAGLVSLDVSSIRGPE